MSSLSAIQSILPLRPINTVCTILYLAVSSFARLTYPWCIPADHIFKPGNQSFDEKTDVDSSCLAVVPWVPSEAAMSVDGSGGYKSQSKLPQEPMASAEAEAESMEVEEAREQAITYGESGEGFQQWWQHCMTPRLLPTMSSPMMWSW